MATETMLMFLSWNKTDPDGYVSKYVKDVGSYAERLDQYHEKTLTR